MKPLSPEQSEERLGSLLRTCQRLLISATENDPSLLTYEPWHLAFENCGRMIREHNERILASVKEKAAA